MKAKQIVFTALNTAELKEIEVAPPDEHEVQVAMKFTTISNGTERANLVGDLNVSPWVPPVAADSVLFPRTCGYSGAGVVVAVGGKVTAFKPGDRVAGSWGKHASVWNYPERELTALAPETSFAAASMAHISTFPMAAIRKARVELGESALVMGQGILGSFAVMLLRQAGACPVIAADPNPSRRALALKLGADFAFDPTAPDFAAQVRAATPNGAGVNAVIEVTGLGAGLQQSLECVARFGRVVLLGCTRHSDFTIDWYRKVHGPGVRLIGAHTMARPAEESAPGMWTTADDRAAFLRLCASGRVDPLAMVGEVRSPDEAPEVFLRLATDRAFPMCVQFDWERLK